MIIDSNTSGNPSFNINQNHVLPPSQHQLFSPQKQEVGNNIAGAIRNGNDHGQADVDNLIPYSKRWLDLEVQKQHHLAQFLYFQQLAEQEEINRAAVISSVAPGQSVNLDLDIVNAQGGVQKTSAWIASLANGDSGIINNLNNGPSPKTIVTEEEQNLNELLTFVSNSTPAATPSLSPKASHDQVIVVGNGVDGQSAAGSPATIASRSSFSSSSVEASVATPRSSTAHVQFSSLENLQPSSTFVPKDLANAFRPSAPLLASSTRGSKDWTDITSYAALYNTNTDLALSNGSVNTKNTFGGKDMQRQGQEQPSSNSSSLEGNNNTSGTAPSAIGGSQFVKSFTPVQSPYGRGASLPGFENNSNNSGSGNGTSNMATVGMNSGTINPYSSGGMGIGHHYASPASAIRTTGNAGMDNGMIGYSIGNGYMPYGGYNQMGPQQGSYMGGNMGGYHYSGNMDAPPPMHMGELPMPHGHHPGNGYMPEVIGASQYMRHGGSMSHDALGEYHRNMAKENAGKVQGFSGSTGVKMESVSQSPQQNHAQRGSFGGNNEEDEIADDGEVDDLEAEMEAALESGKQRTVGRPSKQGVSNSTRSAPYDLDSSRNRASVSGSSGSGESGSKSARQYISKNILFEDGKPKVRNPLGGGRGYVPGQTPDDPRKRHKCDVCGRAFARLYNLKSHASTHDPTRTKPFSCPHADCTRSFSRLHDLERHRQGIHADGPLMEARILGVSPAFARAQARMDTRAGSTPASGPPADTGPGSSTSGTV